MPMKSEDTSLVVPIMCGGVEHAYRLFMDVDSLNGFLKDNGCRQILKTDWAFDTSLDQNVRNIMEKNGTPYSVCMDGCGGLLYYHVLGGGCYMVSLKYLKPFSKSDVEVDIDGKIYTYFMTNDKHAIDEKLKELNCLPPKTGDWKANYSLHKNVIDKMEELGAIWSLTESHNVSTLNFYKKGVPYVIRLGELYGKQQNQILCGAIARMIKEDNTEMLAKLIEGKESMEIPSLNSWTPLMLAAYFKSEGSVKMLLSMGVDVNAQNEDGITALMIAASQNSMDVARLLLKNGADRKIRAKNNWSAITHAYTANNMEIVELLSENGDEISQDIIQAKTQWQPFPQKLSYYINRFTAIGDKKPCDIYKNTCGFLSKQTFSKLQSTIVHPSKKNILLLSIGMKLALGETEDLLASAGLGFSESKQEDRIVRKFIGQRNYDIFEINDEIYRETKKNFFGRSTRKENDIEDTLHF